MRIRGGSGLGDCLYLRAVAEHLARQGHRVTACTDYAGVFHGSGIAVEPFRRDRVDRIAHYSPRKSVVGTTQWEDVCDVAQIERIPLAITWTVRNHSLIDRLRGFASGRPLVLVHGGRAPMARTDGFGKELLPKAEAFDEVLVNLQDCFLVQIGGAEQLYPLSCDITLNGSTSVPDLLDLGASCDGVVGQCSFAIPLAEVFDRPGLFVWASEGMQSGRHPYVRQITPQKVLSKASSMFVVDDWERERIEEGVRAFRQLL